MKRITAFLASIFMVVALATPALSGGNGCDGCTQEVDLTAIASPYKADFQSNAYGGWFGEAGGTATTNLYAEGTKFAAGKPFATGTAIVDGGGFAIDLPKFKLGAVGSYAKIDLEGEAFGIGVDDYAYGPDKALIDIDLQGFVWRGSGGYVGDGLLGFGGEEQSGADFWVADWDHDYSSDFTFSYWKYSYRYGWYKKYVDVDLPAIADDGASASALAAGGIGGIALEGPNGAGFLAVGANFATWDSERAPWSNGNVFGDGTVVGVATKIAPNSGYGQVSGMASWCYDAPASFGGGIGVVGGVTQIQNFHNGQTVTSKAFGFAAAKTNGGQPD